MRQGQPSAGLPRAKRTKARVLGADKEGWLEETRQRWRREFVREAAANLLRNGVCIKGCCRVLHCSPGYLYEHARKSVDDAEGRGYIETRKHGSRKGLPSMQELAGVQCCELGCLATLSPAAGAKSWNFLETQHALWAAAEGRKGRLSALLSFMYDTTTGSISSRCMRSFKLQLGVSNYLLQLVHTALVKGHTEELPSELPSELPCSCTGRPRDFGHRHRYDNVVAVLHRRRVAAATLLLAQASTSPPAAAAPAARGWPLGGARLALRRRASITVS